MFRILQESIARDIRTVIYFTLFRSSQSDHSGFKWKTLDLSLSLSPWDVYVGRSKGVKRRVVAEAEGRRFRDDIVERDCAKTMVVMEIVPAVVLSNY